MHKLNQKLRTVKFAFAFLLMLGVILSNLTGVQAAVITGTNQKTGYKLILDDQAGYYTDTQTEELKEYMEEIAVYCNIAVVTTTSHNNSSTASFASDYYDEAFGPNASGIVFVIDRCLNEIYLCVDGNALKTITKDRAYTITDNTYIYATSSRNYDYYTCTYKTLEQILTLMEGGRIAQPMKYICSALLALIIALLLNYFIAMFLSKPRKADAKQVLSGMYTQFTMHDANAQFMNQTKVYSPQSSSSGGHSGGGHSGGGGGHSGGGHSI